MLHVLRIRWTWPLRILVATLATLSLTFGVLGVAGLAGLAGAPQAAPGGARAGGDMAAAGATRADDGVVVPDAPDQEITLTDQSADDASLGGANRASAMGASSASTTRAKAAGTASLRILHASPNAPGLDALVDGGSIDSDLTYAGITGYHTFSGNATHNVRLALASNHAQTVARAAVHLLQGHAYTLALFGLRGASSAGERLRERLFNDVNTSVSGRARVRAIALAAGRHPLDVYMKPSGGSFFRRFFDIGFGGATGYLSIPTGGYSVAVARFPSTSVSQAYFTANSAATLNSGTTHTLWFLGGDMRLLVTRD